VIKETGKVVAVEKDGLWVETLKSSACSQCSAKRGCGVKLLSRASLSSNMTFIKAFFVAPNSEERWSVDDQAVLGIEEHALVFAALIAYGVPLMLLILGALGGSKLSFFSADVSAALGAFVGLMVGALLVRLHARFSRNNTYYQARVLGKNLEPVNTHSIVSAEVME